MKKLFLLLTMLLFSASPYICPAQDINQTALLNLLKKTKHPAKEVVTLDEVRLNPYDFKHTLVAIAEFQSVEADISTKDLTKEYDSTKYKQINCGGKLVKAPLPLIVSLKSQKNISDKLLDLKEGDMVLLGGKIKSFVQKDSKGKKLKDTPKKYVFEIDFVESIPEEILNAPTTDEKEEEKTKSESKTKQSNDSSKENKSSAEQDEDSDISFDTDEDTEKPANKKTDEKSDDDEKQEGVEWLD